MVMQVWEMLCLILCYHLTHRTKCIRWLGSLFLSVVPPFFQPPRLEILDLVFIRLACYPLTLSLNKSVHIWFYIFYIFFPSTHILLIWLQKLNADTFCFMPECSSLIIRLFLYPTGPTYHHQINLLWASLWCCHSSSASLLCIYLCGPSCWFIQPQKGHGVKYIITACYSVFRRLMMLFGI